MSTPEQRILEILEVHLADKSDDEIERVTERVSRLMDERRALYRLQDAARDMMYAMGKHTQACSTCKTTLRRHADVLAPLRREPESPRTEERT